MYQCYYCSRSHKIANLILNVNYIITRYSCGHYSLYIAYPTYAVHYSRLRRGQVDAVVNVSCKDIFHLAH